MEHVPTSDCKQNNTTENKTILCTFQKYYNQGDMIYDTNQIISSILMM